MSKEKVGRINASVLTATGFALRNPPTISEMIQNAFQQPGQASPRKSDESDGTEPGRPVGVFR